MSNNSNAVLPTITSWIGKTIKIKDEYIFLDNSSNQYVITQNALQSFLRDEDNISDLRFHVKQDIYGVDLFSWRNGKKLDVDNVEMTHQVIIECESKVIFNYPFLWDSIFFELV
jgi:hypothetical protein